MKEKQRRRGCVFRDGVDMNFQPFLSDKKPLKSERRKKLS